MATATEKIPDATTTPPDIMTGKGQNVPGDAPSPSVASPPQTEVGDKTTDRRDPDTRKPSAKVGGNIMSSSNGVADPAAYNTDHGRSSTTEKDQKAPGEGQRQLGASPPQTEAQEKSSDLRSLRSPARESRQAAIESTNLMLHVTRHLFIALCTFFTTAVVLAILAPQSGVVVPEIVIATGVIGGFVGLQRRLKDLTVSDLQLMADSWVYTCLSPVVGGILALLLCVVFLAELLPAGGIFPHFTPSDAAKGVHGFSTIFTAESGHYQEYAKLIVWSFVAGFSERFVTDVISRFEGTSIKQLPQTADVGVNLAKPNHSAL